MKIVRKVCYSGINRSGDKTPHTGYRVTILQTLLVVGVTASVIELQYHCRNISLYRYDFCARAAVECIFTRTGRHDRDCTTAKSRNWKVMCHSSDVTTHTNRISLLPSTVPTSGIILIHMCAFLFQLRNLRITKAVEIGLSYKLFPLSTA